MRTLVNISDEDIVRLDVLAAQAKRSRAAEIREAVKADFVHKLNNDWIVRGAGCWKNRTDIDDAIEYQRTLREDRTTD